MICKHFLNIDNHIQSFWIASFRQRGEENYVLFKAYQSWFRLSKAKNLNEEMNVKKQFGILKLLVAYTGWNLFDGKRWNRLHRLSLKFCLHFIICNGSLDRIFSACQIDLSELKCHYFRAETIRSVWCLFFWNFSIPINNKFFLTLKQCFKMVKTHL